MMQLTQHPVLTFLKVKMNTFKIEINKADHKKLQFLLILGYENVYLFNWKWKEQNAGWYFEDTLEIKRHFV